MLVFKYTCIHRCVYTFKVYICILKAEVDKYIYTFYIHSLYIFV